VYGRAVASVDPIRPIPPEDAETQPLRNGRTLTLAAVGPDQLVEIHGAGGQLELRIRLTEEGPVLEMDSIKLVLRAAEAVQVDTKDFNLNASGGISIDGKAAVAVNSDGHVHVTGEIIHLN
jgi:hypothetical protein